jgi:hypothetical protein
MAAPPKGAAEGSGETKKIERLHTPPPRFLQLSPTEDSLDRLQQFRRSLDHWHETGCADRMPKPADFGLCLPVLHPSEVLWNSGGRP